jgi:hypothetical protein
MSLPARLHHRLAGHRHTALLASIVFAFALRPLLGESAVVAAVFSLAMVVLLLVALYAISLDELVGDRERLLVRRRRRHVMAWVLAVPAIVERIVVTIWPNPRFYLVSAVCWMLFLGYVTWVELRSVLEQRQVTGETISMAISVYLLIGITWGMLYYAMFELDPRALSFGQIVDAHADPGQALRTAFPLFIYFSLATLSTLGAGDIMPVSLPARYAVVAEAITGQLYLAILIARLVTMQLSESRKGDGV